MNIFITRKIPNLGIELLRSKGYEVDISDKDGVLSKDEIISRLSSRPYDAVLCLLTDTIDEEVFNAAPHAKIFANYAVGYNNIDTEEAKKRGIIITNTPDVLTNTVAEYTCALVMALSKRIVEADDFTRSGKYEGWAPELFLGSDLRGKTFGILGVGRIGSRVAHMVKKGFEMNIAYYDVNRNKEIEDEIKAVYFDSPEKLLRNADIVSVHVPLLDTTMHLIDKKRLAMMKPSAYLINTSRGPVVDEAALVEALRNNTIRGAAIDVFENEPHLAEGLADLPNVIITPHIASATEETRSEMSRMAAENIIAVLEGNKPLNLVV